MATLKQGILKGINALDQSKKMAACRFYLIKFYLILATRSDLSTCVLMDSTLCLLILML